MINSHVLAIEKEVLWFSSLLKYAFVKIGHCYRGDFEHVQSHSA